MSDLEDLIKELRELIGVFSTGELAEARARATRKDAGRIPNLPAYMSTLTFGELTINRVPARLDATPGVMGITGDG